MKVETQSFLCCSSKLYVDRGLPNQPTISTHNLIRQTDRDKPITVEELKWAAEKLVEANPILSSALSKNKLGHLTATSGLNTDLIKIVDFPPHLPLPPVAEEGGSEGGSAAVGKQELVRYFHNVMTMLAPSLPVTKEQWRRGLPIFRIVIVPISEQYLYYSFQMSHAVGDGNTFYMLQGQLSSLVETGSIPPDKMIRWHHDGHGFFDTLHYPVTLVRIACIIVLAILAKIFHERKKKDNLQPEPTNVLFLSRDKINQEKGKWTRQDMKDQSIHLSTNDLIVMALCQSTQHYFPIIYQSINYRTRYPNYLPRDGGNMATSIILDSSVTAADPYALRAIAKDPTLAPYGLFVGQRYPFWKLVQTAGRLCSVVNIQPFVKTEGSFIKGTIGHIFYEELIAGLWDKNAAVLITAWNDDTVAVTHNLRATEFCPDASIFPRMQEHDNTGS